MKKLWNVMRGDIPLSLGFLLLAAGFLLTVRTALHRFDFYSLTPVGAEVQTARDEPTESDGAEQEKTADRTEIPYITDTRTVREYRGILGVYDCFGNLLETFDADLTVLPPQDRTLLCDGMVFASEGEMRNFLESLNS